MGRELDVALIIENRLRDQVSKGLETSVSAIILPPNIRGYVFLESNSLTSVFQAISDIKYVKTSQPMIVSYEDIERLVKPKPVIELVNIGDMVEIVRGPFRGMKAQVTSINKSKNTITLNVLEAAFAVPIEVPSEYVKPIKKGE
uniref:Transcription elongation factor Spt5 n=1 Tax=Staphylothermus marinus TaxID=2280 RepID=A0A7C4HF28_STAMA